MGQAEQLSRLIRPCDYIDLDLALICRNAWEETLKPATLLELIPGCDEDTSQNRVSA